MRILQIRFKNLNSLTGEWSIDLTHPAYGADGLFAITGPTGSGKSTILDAICLALYGRTPRLERVNKSENEILSRQTGECFAEVTFETRTGRYCCQWSQRRARKRPDGELQIPRHELADADSGAVIAEKVRGVAEQIEAVTGMNFERFTRSMLLAQGDFAAFLQADPNERSPILEQITGTEIYSLISMKVHQRTRDENGQLRLLEAELSGLKPLTEEEETALEVELAEKRRSDQEKTKEVEKARGAIAWLDAMAALEKDITELEGQWAAYQQREVAFQPDRIRLDRANTALALDGAFARLSELRQQQAADQQALCTARQEAPRLEGAARSADAAWSDAQSRRRALRETRDQESAVQKKVREQDQQLGTMNQRLKDLSKEMGALEKTREQTGAEKTDHEQRLAQARAEMETLLAYLRDHEADGALVEKLAGLRQVCKALTASWQACGVHEKALEQARGHSLAARKQRETSAVSVETAGHGVREARDTLNRLSAQEQDLLQGREPGDWRRALSEDRERRTAIGQVADGLETLERLRKEQAELEADRANRIAEREALDQAARLGGEEEEALRREVEHLEKQAALESRIRDLEEERARLEAGQPCPLCGATEHPFARPDAIPPVDTTAAALQKARAGRDAAGKALRKAQIGLAETDKEIELLQRRERQLSEAQDQARSRCGAAADALGLDPALPNLPDQLGALGDETEARIHEASAVIEKLDLLEKDLRVARIALEQSRDALVQAEKALATAIHAQEKAEVECQRLEDMLREESGRRDALQAEAAAEATGYGITDLAPDRIEALLATLTSRRDAWQERQERRGACERGIETRTLQIENLSATLQQQDRDLVDRRDALLAQTRERDALAAERQALYGDKNPDAEEARLARDLGEAEEAEEQARAVQTQAHKALSALQADMARLEAAIAQRVETLREGERGFADALREKGFADEGDYAGARLDDAARRALADAHARLAREGTELGARLQDRRNRLDQERKRSVSDRPREDLAGKAEALDGDLRALREQIGALLQRLQANTDLRTQRKERLAAIEGQRAECARWDALDQIIGSSDGKKYRNFVQGLTFEIMIGHANRQLRQMTDRYLLIRNEHAPLELNVMDHYQAGEIRSTKNLSGGESFLVSLALALGLSQMASRNVRVDSLFLDEGFGTLDEDALETALQTLAGLRQDGKLIGVISHVAALQERISARIQVAPQTGGRSVLRGPGCAAVGP